MAQHFLLSARARTLNLRSVLSMSEARAYAKFKKLAWQQTDGKPVCPDCGVLDHWVLVEDRKWKCKGCRLQFTVTSGTPFKSRKLSFRNLLAAIAMFTNGVLGVAACRLSRDCKISYKSAFVLAHKMREAMGAIRTPSSCAVSSKLTVRYSAEACRGYRTPRSCGTNICRRTRLPPAASAS